MTDQPDLLTAAHLAGVPVQKFPLLAIAATTLDEAGMLDDVRVAALLKCIQMGHDPVLFAEHLVALAEAVSAARSNT